MTTRERIEQAYWRTLIWLLCAVAALLGVAIISGLFYLSRVRFCW